MAAARAPGRRLDTPGVLRRRCAGPGVPRRSHMARLAGCLGVLGEKRPRWHGDRCRARRGWREPDVGLTQKRAHRRRRSSKGRYRMICPAICPIGKARIWDAHPAPQLLFFRSAVAHRRVGSSFPSSMLLLSTIGRRHDGHKAVRV
uniref:Uncharacterized protein n=1 Tax=Setaria italica TaxID=4555 RepID=K3XMZ2_SETIT